MPRLEAAAVVLLCGVAPATSAAPPTLRLPRLSAPPRLEDFLDMAPRGTPAREMAEVGPFVQRYPDDGALSSGETRAYVGYDEERLYVVFVCHETGAVRSRLTRREGTEDYEDDMVEVRLDTFDDRRRSFFFGTNPRGVQLDALWPEVGGDWDSSFDTVWDSDGRLTDGGYVTWMAIPFRSLRFPPGEVQTWGIYFSRWDPRRGEKSFWPEVSRSVSSRLQQMARLEGLEGIARGRNWQLNPYGSFRSFELTDPAAGPARVRDAADAALGLDAKLVLRDTLALDLTVNPDFAQVESDEAQVTTNQRFEVFFPERRPFFIENAGFFETPLDLVFTRRIADPSRGARLTGKLGSWTVGALAIDDEAPRNRAAAGTPPAGESARIGIVRVTRDLFSGSSLGALFTERRLGSGHNRVGGVDLRLRLGDTWSSELQAVASRTRDDGASRAGAAYRARVARTGRRFRYALDYEDLGRDFRTDLGFVPRTGIRRWEQEASFARLSPGIVHQIRGSVGAELVTDRKGRRLDWELRPGLLVGLERLTGGEIVYVERRERLMPADFPLLTAPADFAPSRLEVAGWTSPWRWLSGWMRFGTGRGINLNPPPGQPPGEGDLDFWMAQLDLRPLPPLEIRTRYLRTALRSPDGPRIFTDEIVRSRLSWQLGRALSLRTILRYESTQADPALTSLESRRSLNADFLVTYLVHPGTALFVGYNHDGADRALLEDPPRLVPVRELRTRAWQVFVKAAYLFRF